ncbi:MAG: HAMP domain-containing histidine kinase [Lachnospiraceae bacterium]|nr:HAMP domain-containing histidine kinase [Lachnospiraceae bacterium]
MSIETYHQDIGMELAQKDNQINDLTDRLTEKENRIIRVERDNQNLKTDFKKLQDDLRTLESEKKNLQENASKESEKGSITGLLPPIDEEDGRETINIIAVAKEASEELYEDAKKANLHVNVSSPTDTLLVRADYNRIITLFRNIIDNSIKYMNKAGSLVITISTIGDDIFIVLKDTGEGLPEDETKHIFELNYQGSNRISGNGLGLAQAKAIVESYGGTIYAKSTEGKGMGIYIQIPT